MEILMQAINKANEEDYTVVLYSDQDFKKSVDYLTDKVLPLGNFMGGEGMFSENLNPGATIYVLDSDGIEPDSFKGTLEDAKAMFDAYASDYSKFEIAVGNLRDAVSIIA